MKEIIRLYIAFVLFLSFNIPSNVQSQGNLVIAGGGLEDNNVSVYRQMIDLAGGVEKASFAVIPSASGVAIQSWASFRNTLISYGVKPGNIHLIKVAMVDDDSTTDVNEAEWRNNGDDTQLASLVRTCSAVWFTGGDQARTTKTLVRPDGSKTPLLEAVWEVYRSGGLIGGSSAGAAIMSEAMIGGGNSLAALKHGVITGYQGDDFPESDGLLMGEGLGFFPLGIVDQHFEQRARIGRLVVALMHEKSRFNKGFGIDENTALIYLGSQNLIKIAGAGGVTIIDTRDARFSYIQERPCIENLTVSYLQDGDTYNSLTGIVTAAEGKKATRGNEYYDNSNPGQAGILSANATGFSNLATIGLIDNKGAEVVKNISFTDQDSGFMVTLSKSPASEGFYTDKPDGEDHYTVINLRMDIVPVQVTISTLK